jgi:hypothetical protein
MLESGYEINSIKTILAKKGIDEKIIREVIEELESVQYEKYLSRRRRGTTLFLVGITFLTLGLIFMLMSESIYSFNSLSATFVSIGMIGIAGSLLTIFTA